MGDCVVDSVVDIVGDGVVDDLGDNVNGGEDSNEVDIVGDSVVEGVGEVVGEQIPKNSWRFDLCAGEWVGGHLAPAPSPLLVSL